MKNKLTTIAILSVAFLCQIRGTIANSMNLLFSYYSTYSHSTVSLLISVVSLAVIPVSILCAKYVGSKITYKQAIIIMNITLLIGGIMPYFIHNLYIVLFFRLIFGIGIGIAISLNKSIIVEYYHGNQKIKYLGYASIIASGGTIFFQTLVGFFSQYSTKAIFLAYTPILVTLFLSFFIPDIPLKEYRKNTKYQFNTKLLSICFIFFILNMLMTCLTIHLSSLISYKIEHPTGVIVMSNNINSILSVISGLLFDKIYKKYKFQFLPISLLLTAFSLIIYILSNQSIHIYLASALFGFSYNFVVLYIFLLSSKSVGDKDAALAGGYMGVVAGIGGFLSSLLIHVYQLIFHESIYSISITTIIVLLLSIIYFKKFYKIKKRIVQ